MSQPEPSAARRAASSRRAGTVAAGFGLLVAVFGGLGTWLAVEDVVATRADQAAARVAHVDLERHLQARLDAALGRRGLAGSAPDDADRTELLERLGSRSDEARRDVEVLRERERDVLERTVATGEVDERDLSAIHSASREVERSAVRPHREDVADATRRLRSFVVATATLSAAAWLAALAMARRPPEVR